MRILANIFGITKPEITSIVVVTQSLATRRRKNSDTENDRNNGLRMRNEMTMKEKRFSFFADPQERKTESRHTFGTLPFARHTSQRFTKGKEPNLAVPQLLSMFAVRKD